MRGQDNECGHSRASQWAVGWPAWVRVLAQHERSHMPSQENHGPTLYLSFPTYKMKREDRSHLALNFSNPASG